MDLICKIPVKDKKQLQVFLQSFSMILRWFKSINFKKIGQQHSLKIIKISLLMPKHSYIQVAIYWAQSSYTQMNKMSLESSGHATTF